MLIAEKTDNTPAKVQNLPKHESKDHSSLSFHKSPAILGSEIATYQLDRACVKSGGKRC